MVNSFYLLAIVVVTGIAGLLLWNRHNSTDARTGRARRALLIDRAEGRIPKEEFEDRQAALDSALLDSAARSSALPIVGAVIGAGLITAALLAWLGERTTGEPPRSTPGQLSGPSLPPPGGEVPRKQGGDLRDLAKPLALKLEANPEDGQGWLLLARTYLEIRQFKEAEAAFAKASTRVPKDAQMLIDWADAQVGANNQTWTPSARDLLKKAMALDPKNLKALTMAAAEADSRNDARQATGYRQQIAKLTASLSDKPAESGTSPTPGLPARSSFNRPAFPAKSGD